MSVPVGSAVVGKVIDPDPAATVPRLVEPLTKNVTVPVGVNAVATDGVIWAVNVTVVPGVVLVVLAPRPTVVGIFCTVWDTVPDEGARALEPVLVPCDDLGAPGDVDYPEDLPERLR